MANKLRSFIFIFIMLFASTSFAAPPADFLNTEVYAIIPVNGLADGGAPLKRFVDTGLKSGVWKKIAENQWTYRITNIDPVSRKKVDVTLQFIKTPLQEFKGKKVIVLNRVVDGGREYSPRDVYNFFMQIAGNLPATQQELKQSSEKDDREKLEKQNQSNQAVLGLFRSYENYNGQSMRLDRLSKDKLKLSMQIVKTQQNVIDDRAIPYNPREEEETPPVANQITETEHVACKFEDKIASFKIGKDDMGWDLFSVIFEEPDCSIKIYTTSGFSGFLEAKYKGSCSKYCNGQSVEKFGGFGGSYHVVSKQEAQPVNEWK